MGDFQKQFRFDKPSSEDGYAKWLASRQAAARELAQKLGLPLEQQVEVWLTGEIRLRGKLRLQEQVLFVEPGREQQLGLVVDKVQFAYGEMQSCVRLD
jgi:hypothetical protein